MLAANRSAKRGGAAVQFGLHTVAVASVQSLLFLSFGAELLFVITSFQHQSISQCHQRRCCRTSSKRNEISSHLFFDNDAVVEFSHKDQSNVQIVLLSSNAAQPGVSSSVSGYAIYDTLAPHPRVTNNSTYSIIQLFIQLQKLVLQT